MSHAAPVPSPPKPTRIKPEPYCPSHGKMLSTSTQRRKNLRYFACPHCKYTAKEIISAVERVITDDD